MCGKVLMENDQEGGYAISFFERFFDMSFQETIDAKYDNVVFVGLDEEGVARHAPKRGTNSKRITGRSTVMLHSAP